VARYGPNLLSVAQRFSLVYTVACWACTTKGWQRLGTSLSSLHCARSCSCCFGLLALRRHKTPQHSPSWGHMATHLQPCIGHALAARYNNRAQHSCDAPGKGSFTVVIDRRTQRPTTTNQIIFPACFTARAYERRYVLSLCEPRLYLLRRSSICAHVLSCPLYSPH
jgi:hypothetical protein